MQRCAVLCAITALVAAPASADEACRKEVATAFNKQRTSRVFTMASELKTPSGPVQIKVEYQPPDRMRQTIMAPNQEPLETVLYGQRAYSRQGSKWEELMPAVAQTIIAQVREAAIDPPKEVGNFDCLGPTTLDGKEYLAYRSVEKQADAGARHGRAAVAPHDLRRPEDGPAGPQHRRRRSARARRRCSRRRTNIRRSSRSRIIRMRRW